MEKFGQILALTKNLLIAVRRLSGDGLALSVSLRSPALPLGELSPKVTERARTPTEKNRRSDSIALSKSLLIAA